MRRGISPFLLTLLLFIFASTPSLTFSQLPSVDESRNSIQASEEEDDAGIPRAARLTVLDGDVSFLRSGEKDWNSAIENLPLFLGDHLFTGKKSRAEIQIGRGSYVRLAENTEVTIADLNERIAQFEVTEGAVSVRVDRLAEGFDRFEVDTPGAAFLFKDDGLYRINIHSAESSEIIVRRGSAEATTVDGSLTVREGNKLISNSTGKGDLAIAADTSTDDWDRWTYDRDSAIDRAAPSPDFVPKYEAIYAGLFGVDDLARYGTWTNYPPYGDCWIPRVGPDWAPYREGQWIWAPAVGWTWIANEPWGWAPYHYGRWVYLAGLGWAWVPGFGPQYSPRRSHFWWRPALVFIFNCATSYGNYVGWYPLGPGSRWSRPERYHEHRWDHAPRIPGQSPNDAGRRPRIDPPTVSHGGARPGRNPGGVTVLPIETFNRSGKTHVRPQAPSGELSGAIANHQQPGLPDGAPKHAAVAPVRADGDRDGSRRVFRPDSEIVRRPVLTRNLPPVSSSSASNSSVDRKHSLVTPRQFPAPSRPVTASEGNRDERNRPAHDKQGAAAESGNSSSSSGNSGASSHPQDTQPARPRVNPGADSSNDGSGGKQGARGSERSSPQNPAPPRRNNDSNSGKQTDHHSAPQHNNGSGAEQHSTPSPQHNNDSGGAKPVEHHSPPPSPPPQHDSGGKASEPSHKPPDPPAPAGKKG